MNLNIAVVDDKRPDTEKLRNEINTWFAEHHNTSRTVTCFPDGEALMRVWRPSMFQIVFLDIIMNRLNGIQTAQRLRCSDSKALLVFTTTSREYVFDAFPLHPFDYIVKPCDPEKLDHVLTEAVRVLELPEPFLNVRISRNIHSIPLSGISAILSHDHFVDVVLANGKCLLCSMAFREAEAGLCGDPRFLLCNRGLIINMDCVASLSRDRESFIMNDGSYYAIKVRGRGKIIADFTQYQISRMRRESRR